MHPSINNTHILVIGAGVSGLTTAHCLLQRGYQVTIIAEKFVPQIVSSVAGALWEWPPAISKGLQDQRSLERCQQWSVVSYEKFFELATDEQTGVHFRPANFYFHYRVEDDPWQLQKMTEVQHHVQGFRHDAALINEHGVNPQLGFLDVYQYLAPMVDTDSYLNWLLHQLQAAGCRVLTQRIDGYLREQEEQLKRQFGVDAIVNCSGLGARELAQDDMYPLRGALVRVKNDGSCMPRITESHSVLQDREGERSMVFVIPRGKNMLMLGGLTEPDEWSTDITLENYPPMRDMLQHCIEFLPILKHACIDPDEPVRVGLRPFCRENVRLEVEAGTHIIHNYGHGGAGVTYSWGCAQEVVELMGIVLT